jgi:mannose-6-phosphate isomerase-like protein (cupin superfamily)
MKDDRTTIQQHSPVHTQGSEIYIFLGVQMKILLSTQDTGGQFSLIEGLMPPGGDGGLHVHTNEDESMHLLEGELEVTIGDHKFLLASGESYFAPRNIPHRLRKPSPKTCALSSANDPRRFRRLYFPGRDSGVGRESAAGETSDARSTGETAEARRGLRHQDHCASRWSPSSTNKITSLALKN